MDPCTEPHLEVIMICYHLGQIPEDSDAVPGVVPKDKAKEQKGYFTAPAPIADRHFLACPAMDAAFSSSEMQEVPILCRYI